MPSQAKRGIAGRGVKCSSYYATVPESGICSKDAAERSKNMIKIVAKNYVKPECVQLFKDTAKELIEKSRAEEGNIFYTLNVSKNDPNTLVFIEDWKDQAAIDFHNHTDHFLNILPKLAKLCNGEGDVELFDEV